MAKKKVKGKCHLTIQGWMLDLSDDLREIAAYALVFGFSQDEDSEFKGSINYIAEWLKCSRPTAINVMRSIEEKGLVSKRQITINDVSFNRYVAIIPENTGSKEILLGSKDSLPGSKEILPNNININNTINKNIKEEKNKQKEIELDVDVIEVEVIGIQFEEFWEAYGYKKSRRDAEKAWKHMKEDDKQKAIDFIPAYKQDCAAHNRTMKYPATYLRGETWTDDVTPTAQPQQQDNFVSMMEKARQMVETGFFS